MTPYGWRHRSAGQRRPRADDDVTLDGIDSIEAKPAKAALEAGSMLSSAKAPFVREVGLSGEHVRRFAGPGYNIALEIANLL